MVRESFDLCEFNPKIDRMNLAFGSKTFVMGILNVTPDSFSDGGKFFPLDKARIRVQEIIAQGGDIIDIGGESSRPGHIPVSDEEEWSRLESILNSMSSEELSKTSIDTCKGFVAERALDKGVGMINDIWGLQKDEKIAEAVASHGSYIVIMHNRDDSYYPRDIIDQMKLFFEESLAIARHAGIRDEKIILDPGIGFGKNAEQNIEVLRRMKELRDLGFPLLLGTSRKRFIGHILNAVVEERYEGTLATSVIGVQQGADIIRVHDVLGNKRAIQIADAIYRR